jgi:hypothetical protein
MEPMPSGTSAGRPLDGDARPGLTGRCAAEDVSPVAETRKTKQRVLPAAAGTAGPSEDKESHRSKRMTFFANLQNDPM